MRAREQACLCVGVLRLITTAPRGRQPLFMLFIRLVLIGLRVARHCKGRDSFDFNPVTFTFTVGCVKGNASIIVRLYWNAHLFVCAVRRGFRKCQLDCTFSFYIRWI